MAFSLSHTAQKQHQRKKIPGYRRSDKSRLNLVINNTNGSQKVQLSLEKEGKEEEKGNELLRKLLVSRETQAAVCEPDAPPHLN